MPRARKTPRTLPRTAPTGYRPRVRTREIVCPWESLAPEDGCPPLTATIRENLTFEEIDAIPAVLKTDPETEELVIAVDDATRTAIAPYVLGWNVEAVDQLTGDVVPVPPPAEIGPDAFRAVDWRVAGWLGLALKNVHRQIPGLLEKKAPSASGQETSSDAG